MNVMIMTMVIVVPLPGVDSIVNSSTKRLLPERPSPIVRAVL